MNGLPPSEYCRNFGWIISNGYSRNCPLDQYKTSNIVYRQDPLDFMNTSSKIDHKAVALQYMKMNPQLNGNDIQHQVKTDYELSQSTYKDTFKIHAKYPSMADYIKIANNVMDNHFPDSVKYFYEPEECQKSKYDSWNTNNLKTVNVPFPKSTDRALKYEDKENKVITKKSMDTISPPKITDLGSCYYRNDISTESMPRHQESVEEYITEAKKRLKNVVIRNEFEKNTVKEQKRKPKRYIDSPVY